ncbi:MAG TPA: hypothetical protein VJL59_10145 [Anaerolineales bacterium]|nr:hypothetical protein [Anaerolineales bacterium]
MSNLVCSAKLKNKLWLGRCGQIPKAMAQRKDMRELLAAQPAFAADGDVTVDGVDGRPGATLVQSIDYGLSTAAVLS